MIGTIALAFGLATAQPEFSVDLFLVANNPVAVTNLDWFDKGTPTTDVQRALGALLTPLHSAKRGFFVFDGGDCSVFPENGATRKIDLIDREYDGYDSMTESVTVRGRTTKRVLARTETVGTSSSTIQPKPTGAQGYMSRVYFYVPLGGGKKCGISMEDANSYRTSLHAPSEQDRPISGRSIVFTAESLTDSEAVLNDQRFDGICVSPWGRSRIDPTHYLSFPPAGVVAHYKLIGSGGRISASLIEYVRA